MGTELQLKQNQVMSQRVLQSVKILQMTAAELGEYVNELAMENPVMDIKEPSKESIEQKQWLNSLHEENHYLYQRHQNDDDYDPKDTWNFQTDQSETLYDYLHTQLITHDYSPLQNRILDFMLESLDTKGYLTESVEDIAAWFHVKPSVVEHLLSVLQSLEPAGVGARSLQECLLLQIKARGFSHPVYTTLIHECLDLIAKSKYPAIARKLQVSVSEAADYCQVIKTLNPKPGSAFYNREEMKYIIPDVTIVKFHDHFDILLNESMYPQITINPYYQKMNLETEDDEVRSYLNQKIRQTEWVRQCIVQRGTTLMAVSKEILKNQEDFFVSGPGHLHPLKLTDIAEAIGMHESTISRAVDKKYLQCSWGMYPLAFFFRRNAAPHTGGFTVGEQTQLTNSDIKRSLQEIISQENKKKPYSDRILSELLAEKGISISRRTVAKYREEEGIPDASGRKEY